MNRWYQLSNLPFLENEVLLRVVDHFDSGQVLATCTSLTTLSLSLISLFNQFLIEELCSVSEERIRLVFANNLHKIADFRWLAERQLRLLVFKGHSWAPHPDVNLLVFVNEHQVDRSAGLETPPMPQAQLLKLF